MENFKELLREQIKEKRISGVSREMGVSRTIIYRWLDNTEPLLRNYLKLVEISKK